jgi:hypothetical protein
VGVAVFTVFQMLSVARAQDGGADLVRVCKGAIAAMMGRDVRTIHHDQTKSGIAYVSYVRPDDGKLWKNRCRIDGKKVIWSTVDAFGPGSGFGPWRNRPEDEQITYQIKGKSVTITEAYSDGSKSTNTMIVE